MSNISYFDTLDERGPKQAFTVELHNLLSSGHNINDPIDDEGNTLLHKAALHRNRTQVEVLLRFGADPELQNKHGKKSYELASYFKNYGID